MRFLFINDFHVPQLYRGTEVNTHALAQRLISLGHTVEVLCVLKPEGMLGLWSRAKLKVLPGDGWVTDKVAGYPTHRCWGVADVLPRVCERQRPDFVVLQSGDSAVIDAAAKLNWPICLYFHFVPDWTSLPNFSHISYVTNSLFCQRRILERFGLSSKVIRPIVLPENYQTAMDPVEVTAFSLSLIKGTDIVLDLAEALPDIPFRIFANQRTRGSEATKLLQRARGLANLRISPPVPTGGRVYQRTRVVLAPSRWEETWGRIATEAHVNDIPVLASDRGGLPEAVGPGGLCLPIDVPLTQWRDALKQLFYDEEARARMATEIGRHRASPLIDPEAITFAFVDTARACLGHLDIDAASSAAV